MVGLGVNEPFKEVRDWPVKQAGLIPIHRVGCYLSTHRSPESALSSAHPPTDMERMLRNYRWAREKAKVEIAQARERLRERTAQEKLRIHQQIVSQLLKVRSGVSFDCTIGPKSGQTQSKAHHCGRSESEAVPLLLSSDQLCSQTWLYRVSSEAHG